MNFYYEAKVSLYRGDRKISAFMRNAGLGISGLGVADTLTITYKPGVEVDEARVLKGFEQMKKDSDEQKTPFEIYSYRLMSLRKIELPTT